MSVKVLSWVLEHSPVTQKGDLLALIVLADHAHDDGDGAYPSVATIARKARLSERGARLALRHLEQLGAIRATGTGPNGVTIYSVATTPAASSSRQPVPPGSQRQEGGNSDAQTPEAASPEPSGEPSTEPSGPPRPPTGGRRRDSQRHDEDFASWAGEHFPGVDHGYVRNAIHTVEGRGQPLTPENLRPEVERWTTPVDCEAAGGRQLTTDDMRLRRVT